MMDSVVRNLRVLWRAESIIADVHLRQIILRSGLRGMAALLALSAFLMANLAAFFALEQAWGLIWAASGVGLANLLVAAILLLIAGRTRPGRELELALEVRNTALQSLETDAQFVQQQLAELRDEIRGVKQAVTGFVRNPLDAVLPSMLVPLAGAVVKGLVKSEKTKT
jgi:hypothetical protein